MSKLKRSNSNLNNKNNLASVFLKQRLAQFDREQKYSIFHIERSKVNTNHFLSQIKQCDTFLTTGSLELLGRTKAKEPPEGEDEVCGKPPSGLSKSKSPHKGETPSTPVIMAPYVTPKQREKLRNLSAVRAEWYKEGLRKKETKYERGEKFLEKLREKERFFESLKHSSDEEDDYNPLLLRNAKSGITRLPSFRKPSTRPYSSDERTARSKKSTDHCRKRQDSVVRRLDSTFENINLEDTQPTSKSEVNVKLPQVQTEVRPSIAWQGSEIAEADDEDDENPPEDMMREFLTLKMRVKPKPLHSRIDAFYSQLDEMKRRKEERERSLPYYEKRRRWLMLTRGNTDDNDDNDIYKNN